MAQDPLLVDQIQIEPAESGTRLIKRDSSTGALYFEDAVATSGILLYQLASLRAIANVYLVGPSGLGAEYTAIQDAIDDVPASASATNPYIILVMPGRYDETINIVRDGVHLIGLGQPEIRSELESTPDDPGADHTIIISAQLGTIPLLTRIQGFKISNAHVGKAAIRLVGAAASTVLSTGLQLVDCDVRADSSGGNYSLYGTTAGKVEAENTKFRGSDALAQILCQEMSSLSFRGCVIDHGVGYRYDDSQDEPDSGVGELFFWNCQDMADGSSLTPAISIDNDGTGGSEIASCTMGTGKRIQYSGDQSHYVRNSTLGVLSILETASIETVGSKHEGLLAGNTNAELDEDVRRGDVTLAASTSETVTFDIPFTDDDFMVSFELPSQPANDEVPWISGKAATGFDINFATAQTMTVEWVATRL